MGKIIEPVLLPNDGPLKQILSENKNSNKLDIRDGTTGISQALRLWENKDDCGSYFPPELKVIQDLQGASSLRDQLSCLRVYRNSVLQSQKNTQHDVGNDESFHKSISDSIPTANQIGMYRLLLEFGLSTDTPHALKRAGESCLLALSNTCTTFGSGSNNKGIGKSYGGDAIDTESISAYDQVNQSVVQSLLELKSDATSSWMDPVQTLFDLLSFEPTSSIILQNEKFILASLNILILESDAIERIFEDHYHSNHDAYEKGTNTSTAVVNVNVLQAIEKGVTICTALKLLLAVKNHGKIVPSSPTSSNFGVDCMALLAKLLKHTVIPLVRCKATSSDALFVCSVTLARVLLLWWKLDRNSNKSIAEKSGILMDAMIFNERVEESFASTDLSSILISLPQLNQVAVVKGLVATLPENILSQRTNENSDLLLIEQIAAFILDVANVSTENSARLLGLKGLETVLGRWGAILTVQKGEFGERARNLSNEVLHLALATWESPPSRQISSAVPAVFQSLVKVMEVLDDSDLDAGREKSIDLLVQRVLSQPASRRGKYVALDALLPKIGVKSLMALAKSQVGGSPISLVPSFIAEIGRGGSTSGAVAELLARIMSMLRTEMHKDAGIDLNKHQEGNKRIRKRKEKLLLRKPTDTNVTSEKEEIILIDDWNKVWAPALADGLLNPDLSFRSHVASFCLPQLVNFVGGKGNRIDASHAFAILLEEVCKRVQSDALMWAKLEIVRHVSLSKLLKFNSSSSILKGAISRALPLDLLKSTLFHETPKLRLTAFQSIESILLTYDDHIHDPTYYLSIEVSLWKEALPYAFKCSDKEYVVILTQTLKSFLDRLSAQEEDGDDSLLLQFVIEFLLQDLFVQQAAYPGTVAEKEKWALSMIDSIITFGTQHKSSLSSRHKTSKHETTRKLSSHQQNLSAQILKNILSDSILSTLISLMNSIWDNTRSSAHSIILKILQYAKEERLELPSCLSDKKCMDLLQARAIHLASSPRQREADTGARIISMICATMSSGAQQLTYLDFLSSLLIDRVTMMESALGLFVEGPVNPSTDNCKDLPLAHGLLQAIRLIVETWSLSHLSNGNDIYGTLTSTCFRAVEISLVVVADVKSTGEKENEIDKDRWKTAKAKQSMNVPLNVNTGAIGANASFASLIPIDEQEKKIRLLKQRIIMGTWLLIKEACSTLSSILLSSIEKDVKQLANAGNLLISTLTSLKHQGAAFAAHKALQSLCSMCYSSSTSSESEIRFLPSQWSDKLLKEIISIETVRDSTLRRSTGYGLGFLSILRSEQISPRFLFPHILGNILMITLPPESAMKEQMQRWDASEHDIFIFTKCINSSERGCFVDNKDYEERSRIHALNILRLIILDAPLATEMREFVGDCIISSLIGYKDSSWGIRNSATMCFAAAMLRVVDADKNADMVLGNANSKRTTNAVTCKELFRSYPPLATILLSLIKEENAKGSLGQSVHPTLFPLLLLLARLQPLSLQRTQFSNNSISSLFIDPIIKCLGHIHHKVRLVAARALAVLCSSDHERRVIIQKCTNLLSYSQSTDCKASTSHNLDHGVLLALKFLIGSSTDPHNYLDKSAMDAVVYYSTWGNFNFHCPPSCTSIAIEIWHIAVLSDFGFATRSSLLETAFKVVRAVELLASEDCSRDMIGLSDVAKHASTCTCKLAFSQIVDASVSVKDRMKYIQIVEHCFTSGNYDTMLYAVKAFKKGMYDIAESFAPKSNSPSVINVLESITKLAIRCLSKILIRDDFDAHPPTLRRLTRIALESIYCLKSITPVGFVNVTALVELPVGDLWNMCIKLFHISGYQMSEDDLCHKTENLSGGNALAGNALQLVSFVIKEMSQLPLQSELPQSIQLFMNIIHQSTRPLSSWKIRHSAAIAVRESNLIAFSTASCSEQLFMELIQLFQDSDSDVRHEAGRATFLSKTLPIVSLKHLELASSKLSSNFSTIEMFQRILEQLCYIFSDVERKLVMVVKEINFTILTPDPASILNVSTERKIFEEEDPNPYLEVLVIIHAAILSLSGFPADFIDKDKKSIALFNDVYKMCSRLLDQICELAKKRNNNLDLAHNLSFDANLFAYLHGSILITALGFWFGIEDVLVIDRARKVLKLPSSSIHPCISRALSLLLNIEKAGARSKTSILQNCFLLPSKMHY